MLSDRSAGNMIAVVTIMIATAVASTFGPTGQTSANHQIASVELGHITAMPARPTD